MKRLLLIVFAFLTLCIALPVAHAESCLDQNAGVTDIAQLKPCKPPSKIGNWEQGDTPLANLTRVFADYNGNKGITDGSVVAADNREQNVSAIGDTQKGPFLLRPEAVNALAEAGKMAKQVGYSLRVNSAYRTTKHQISLSNGGKGVASAGKSAHQSGLAVDIVLMKGGKAVTQCCSFKTFVTSDTEADQQLQRIMTAAGWVRFCWETWHFEYGVGNNNGTRSQQCKQNGQGATGPEFKMGGPIAGGGGGGSAATTSGPGGTTTTPSSGGATGAGAAGAEGAAGTGAGGAVGSGAGSSGGAGGAASSGAGSSGGAGGASPNGTGTTSAELGNTNPTGNGSGSNGGLINANLGGKGFAVALQTNFKEAPKAVREACKAAVQGKIGVGPHAQASVGRGEGRVAFTEFSVDPVTGAVKNADEAGNGGWRCSGMQYSYDPATGVSDEIPVLHQVIRGNNGLDLLTQYSNKVYIFLASTIGIFAVLMVVLGGVQMIVSGNGDGITKGKERITAALAGLALLFMSSVILYTINPNFFTWEGNAMYTSAGQAGGQMTGSNVQSGVLTKKPATTAAAPSATGPTPSAIVGDGNMDCSTADGQLHEGLMLAYSASFEGIKLSEYRDSAGLKTIGIGWNIDALGPPPGYSGGKISAADAVAAYKQARSAPNHQASSVMPGTGDAARDAVLNDMAFNMGAGKKGGACNSGTGSGLGGYNCLRDAVAAQKWDEAAKQIMQSKASGQARGLANRGAVNASVMQAGMPGALKIMEQQAKSNPDTYKAICKAS